MAVGEGWFPVRGSEVETQLRVIAADLARLVARDDDHEIRLRAVESRADTSAQLTRVETKVNTVDVRLTAIEKWRWLTTGATAAGGSALVLAVNNFLALSGR